MEEQVPDWAKLWLSEANAAWLHQMADESFDGNVEQTLNAYLDYLREAIGGPKDPWGALMKLQRKRIDDGSPHT